MYVGHLRFLFSFFPSLKRILVDFSVLPYKKIHALMRFGIANPLVLTYEVDGN